MTITRVGTNSKYADGWDKAFAGKRGGKTAAKKSAPSKKARPAKAAKKGRK